MRDLTDIFIQSSAKNIRPTQLTFTCSKSTTETPERDVKYVHSKLTIQTPERSKWRQ